jgi:hypothetical protein
MRYACGRLESAIPEGKNYLGYEDVDGRIILKWILKNRV